MNCNNRFSNFDFNSCTTPPPFDSWVEEASNMTAIIDYRGRTRLIDVTGQLADKYKPAGKPLDKAFEVESVQWSISLTSKATGRKSEHTFASGNSERIFRENTKFDFI